jgi:hypothetical protein
MKAKNNLKTISPESLNWFVSLKISHLTLLECLRFLGLRIVMSPGSMAHCSRDPRTSILRILSLRASRYPKLTHWSTSTRSLSSRREACPK